MDAVGSCLHAFEIDERRDACQAMAVQFDWRFADRLAQRRDQRADAVDGEETAGILQPDRIDLAALDKLLRSLDVNLIGVDRRQTVRDGADGAGTELLGDVQRRQHVVDVVEAVERADVADAIGDETLDPERHDVIRNEVE